MTWTAFAILAMFCELTSLHLFIVIIKKTLPCKIAVHNLTATTTTPTTTSPALSVTTTTTASLDFFGDDFLSALSTTPGSRLAEVGSLSVNGKSGRILLIARQMRHFSA